MSPQELLELLGLKMTKIGVRYMETNTEDEKAVNEDILSKDHEKDMNEKVVNDLPNGSPSISEIFNSKSADEIQPDKEPDGGEDGRDKMYAEENESDRDEVDHEVPEAEAEGDCGDCVVKETEEIQDYPVVWARVGDWPWWPGVVSPRTRRRGRRLLREVVFFGEDDRGINTHSYLVSGASGAF